MVWWYQATSHYLKQCWPRSPLLWGITRPQWVKTIYLTHAMQSTLALTHWGLNKIADNLQLSTAMSSLAWNPSTIFYLYSKIQTSRNYMWATCQLRPSHMDVLQVYCGCMQWHHNECDGISNHQHLICLLNWFFFQMQIKENIKVLGTGLCEGNPPHKGAVTWKMFSFGNVIMGWI